jgi:serpin B
MKRFLVLQIFGALIVGMAYGADDVGLAAGATNQFAVDLHRQLATGDHNLCISPYSVESALAMTFAGADGETREQMSRVLHLPKDGDAADASFSALQGSLEEMTRKTAEIATESKNAVTERADHTGDRKRLFAQGGYDFRVRSGLVKNDGAPFEALDFTKNGCGTAAHQQVQIKHAIESRTFQPTE